MNDTARKPDTQDIVVDEIFPHAPETISSVADAVMGLRVAEAIVAAAASRTAVELGSLV